MLHWVIDNWPKSKIISILVTREQIILQLVAEEQCLFPRFNVITYEQVFTGFRQRFRRLIQTQCNNGVIHDTSVDSDSCGAVIQSCGRFLGYIKMKTDRRYAHSMFLIFEIFLRVHLLFSSSMPGLTLKLKIREFKTN